MHVDDRYTSSQRLQIRVQKRVKTSTAHESTQLVPLDDLTQPLGQGYVGSNCHEKSGSVSFVKTSPIARVIPGSSKDCLKISSEDIRICPQPFPPNQHVE